MRAARLYDSEFKWGGFKFPSMRRSGHSLGSPCLIELPIRQWGTIALARIVDFLHLLDIRLSEPLPDEIDRQDQFMDAKLRTESASSPARDLDKAIFGAP